VNIEPDVDCPHCGMVIICPHTPPVAYPPHCINTPPPRLDVEYTDDFIENMRRRKARKAGATTSRPRPADIAQPGTNPGYVTAAIRSELSRLASAVEGCRNDTLNRVAFAVFGFVKGGHADEQGARHELERIASVIGLPHNEIQATLRSAWTGAEPRDVPAPRVAA
jgi:hypothetical protein